VRIARYSGGNVTFVARYTRGFIRDEGLKRELSEESDLCVGRDCA
jgi:hypothetical protein